jgi:hypothetical protein
LEVGAAQSLPATLVWNYPTIATLANELARRMELPMSADPLHEEDRAPVAEAQAEPPVHITGDGSVEDLETLLADIERLSADEARRSLVGGE